jgi:hypothetical protein
MTRILLLALALTACGCTTAPIVPDAQAQLSRLANEYAAAHVIELDRCWVVTPQCEKVRAAGYAAEGAYVTANSERTASSLNEARDKIGKFKSAADAL